MKIPAGHTEATVLAAIEKTINVLAPTFVFGFYDIDDIRQYGRLKALEVLEKETYDPGRPLENFLYTHIRNRYINLWRDKLWRNDPPCKGCHNGKPCNDGVVCVKYAAWKNLNQAKSGLMRPLDLANICDERERRTRIQSTASDDVEITEILHLIDEKLPVELRTTYLQMRDGVSIPKAKRTEVEQAVKDILREANCSSSNEDD